MEVDTNGFFLEDEVKDKVTGFTGIITGFTQWNTGCARAVVQGPVNKDGKIPDGYSLDVTQLDLIRGGPRRPLAASSKGGPMPTPKR